VPDDSDAAYRELINHPVQEIDRFLLDFELEDEWVGVVGGPTADTADPCLVYDVRTIDGPYQGQLGAELVYRFDDNSLVQALPVLEIYRGQVQAIETAFPDVTVQCYEVESWDA
jgi:hypothetical protein